MNGEVVTRNLRQRAFSRLPHSGVVEKIAIGFLALLVLVAILAPVIAPFDPDQVSVLDINAGPSGEHWLGADSTGRDLLSRLIYGARISLLGPAIIVVIATLLGTALAITAAWMGGIVDTVISRFFDIVFAFPGLLLAILAVAMFGTGLLAPVIALSISYTPWIGRVVRSAAINQRSLPYIEAASVQGFSGFAISLRHLLPNVKSTVFTQATLAFGYALVDLAGISFLGLGVQPPTADWGVMVSEGQSAILEGNAAESLLAGGMIVLTVISVNLIGEGLSRRSAGTGESR